MPYVSPWEAADVLRAVEAALRPRLAALGGTLDVAGDPDHALDLLAVSPARWRVILGWPGYGAHKDAILGMGQHRVYLIIQAAKGLARSGSPILAERPALGNSLAGLIETASRWVRAMKFPDASGVNPHGFELTGSAWLELPGVETLQHQLDFSADAALSALSENIALTLP